LAKEILKTVSMAGKMPNMQIDLAILTVCLLEVLAYGGQCYNHTFVNFNIFLQKVIWNSFTITFSAQNSFILG
jgi:hypothetical protein